MSITLQRYTAAAAVAQNANKDKNRFHALAALPGADVERYQNTISGTTGHQSHTLTAPTDLQVMTSY